MAITLKLLCLAVTFVGVMYAVDGLKCIVCVPKSSRVDPNSQTDATRYRNEIIGQYGSSVKECGDDLTWRAQILVDNSYWKDCTGTDPRCFKHTTGNWSARTCRSGAQYLVGCVGSNNLHTCYCYNKDKCNSAPGLHGAVATIIYAIISALALNKLI